MLAAPDGSRPLLVEVQALVVPTRAGAAAARCRTGSIATGSRWSSPSSAATPASSVGTSDVFVNVVGGVRVDEPGADLAVALAVASAVRGVATDPSPLACFGEVGLTGELRTVAHPDRRAQEAAKFGLRTVVSPGGAGTLRAAIQTALGTAQGRRRAA